MCVCRPGKIEIDGKCVGKLSILDNIDINWMFARYALSKSFLLIFC